VSTPNHTQNLKPQKLIFLTHKRNCRGENYLHTASKRVIDWCIIHQIGTLIIGHNERMKQSLNLGTSQSSDLDRDELPKYGEEKPLFKGKRLARGIDKMGTNQLLNADVNGAFNIIRKVIPDVVDQGRKGLPFNPLRA